MTDLWSPSTDYALGALVLARASAPVVQESLTNAGFESGDSGWTKGANWSIASGSAFEGTWRAVLDAVAGTSLLENDNIVPAVPGQSITAGVRVVALGDSTLRLGIRWLDASDVEISVDYSTALEGASTLSWRQIDHTAIAPPLTAKAQFVVEGVVNTTGGLNGAYVDAAVWNYAYVEVPASLFFEATVAGTSSTSEPTWPTVAAGTVVDGGVTWTARAAVSITWKAVPILKSSTPEPDWPNVMEGEVVSDGSITWMAVSRRIEDARCPHSVVVVKAASKLWSEDGDIVRFCAVNNAKDWTSSNDAGYLPTGLHMNGDNRCRTLGTYRGNLIAQSDSTFQNWAVDEDPAGNALLDKIDGIGSIYHRAGRAVGNDYYMLTALGVRSVGIAAGAQNLQAGDIGMPVDTLIRALVLQAEADGYDVRAFYFPGAGQYWIAFGEEVFVYTMNNLGSVGAWSRYVFPFRVMHAAQLGDDLYVLGDDQAVRRITDTVDYDETLEETLDGTIIVPTYFDSVVQWPHLDCGAPGSDKQMAGFDIIGEGTPEIQFGYNQKDPTQLTTAYEVDEDTLTDDMIAMPLTAPTISVKVTYRGSEGNRWHLNAINLYFLG